MTSSHRNFISLTAIAVALFAAVLCSLLYLSSASDDADRAVADTASVRTAVKRIQLSQAGYVKADTQEQLSAQLPKRLDDAMKAAGIAAENLERILPQPARHVGQADLEEMPLQLVFHGASLQNILIFLSTLNHDNPWLCVRDIHLSRPIEALPQAAAPGWDVELTVSYLSSLPGNGTASAN